MSKEEVGEVEIARVVTNSYDGTILTGQLYEASVGGFDCFVWYYYVGEKLVRAKYDFGYKATKEEVCI